jgi:alkanesulfonate monooxygenase SsuD/methylene tetrahydromethanopterin reductase-like flavin-dependent oxidoreductase (luciferase family)
VTYLREVEPVIEGVDFNAATADEFEAITAELQPATDAYEAEIDAQGCDDLNLDVTDEEAFAALIDLAQQEAPGTVAYLEWIRDFAGAVTGDGGGGGSVSGDCETDIAAIQEFVDRGGTMSDLTMGEVATVTQLITSISTNCTLTRFQEFTSQEDVMEFMSG